jgi:NarL family two-component system response regulator LiaR
MTSQKIRVLIVDDHDMVREGLRVLLDNFDDFDVVADAADGEIAVELCRRLNPDVVLLDMVMPVMNGVTAAAKIRTLCPDTRIVALTSFDDERTVQDALKAGVTSYVMKNVSVDELSNVIRKAYNGQSTLAPEATRMLIRAATRPPSLGFDLSEREREVLAMMTKGVSNREIGEHLYISSSTVKNHVSSILSKLGAVSRTQAVAMAVEHHLVEPEA